MINTNSIKSHLLTITTTLLIIMSFVFYEQFQGWQILPPAKRVNYVNEQMLEIFDNQLSKKGK